MAKKVKLSEDLELKLEALARASGKPVAFHVREAILAYLEDMEDLQIAEVRLADVQAGASKTWALSEVESDCAKTCGKDKCCKGR